MSRGLPWEIANLIFNVMWRMGAWLFSDGLPVGGGLGLLIVVFGVVFGFVFARNFRR